MAWVAPVIEAVSKVREGNAAKDASNFNAAEDLQQSHVAVNQANVQEGMLRRNSRQALGAQAAAFGASGTGYGGSSGEALDQSAINQELDALNTRYKGTFTAYGYGNQSSLDRSKARDESKTGTLLAGATLLKGLGPYYSSPGTSEAVTAGP